eukprot:TRINITY_DN9498_c0_g1_i1.p1 TRINITY_DN9498_c0_g1~~TRINITY_DN9498_c0_g1_i1.p1  ORF type:complete len:638 (+),score=91.30 TRINITY_DN9498_c0_g1_i1:287-1915(+)
MCRNMGIACGADMPIAEIQQHAWFMTSDEGTFDEQVQRIHTHLDWIAAAGFEYLSTENGFSEFTHPNDIQMLGWMNATVSYFEDKYSKKSYIKCHCSTSQTCTHYKDPVTGEPLNFNFLPYYADSRLGIYPHTVQFYTLLDPAPTYGNTNFTYMLNFTFLEAGKREVIFHGETGYWVNYDIDVPLFLPIYASARLNDLRILARGELQYQKKIQGEINFDSGWEWGYWLPSVITALSAWNPRMEEQSDRSALYLVLSEVTKHFATFKNGTDQLAEILLSLCQIQHDLLVLGKIGDKIPPSPVERNGQAYIQGWDTWSDLLSLLGQTSTQPDKIGFIEMRDPLNEPFYSNTLSPLLTTMESNFTSILQQLKQLTPLIPNYLSPLFSEIVDSLEITVLRAKEVHALYDYLWWTQSSSWRDARLSDARAAIDSAVDVVARREKSYRVPVERIAGWGVNPTVYTYGYLWTVHSLYYFYRDYSKATLDPLEAIVPCFMNVINPIDVAVGQGLLLNITEEAKAFLDSLGWAKFIADCMAAPEQEPHYHL